MKYRIQIDKSQGALKYFFQVLNFVLSRVTSGPVSVFSIPAEKNLASLMVSSLLSGFFSVFSVSLVPTSGSFRVLAVVFLTSNC